MNSTTVLMLYGNFTKDRKKYAPVQVSGPICWLGFGLRREPEAS
jgi:hypothetical protein